MLTVGVVPKSTRNPYFEDCRLGVQEAAEELGFKLSWDGPTPEAIGHALSFEVGRVLRGHGSFAAITSTLSAPNQKVWLAEFKTRIAKDYPGIRLLDVVPCDDRSENARNETLRLLEKHVCRFRPSVMLTSKMESSTASSSGRRATSGILLA